jgi:hypothetical protein
LTEQAIGSIAISDCFKNFESPSQEVYRLWDFLPIHRRLRKPNVEA